VLCVVVGVVYAVCVCVCVCVRNEYAFGCLVVR